MEVTRGRAVMHQLHISTFSLPTEQRQKLTSPEEWANEQVYNRRKKEIPA